MKRQVRGFLRRGIALVVTVVFIQVQILYGAEIRSIESKYTEYRPEREDRWPAGVLQQEMQRLARMVKMRQMLLERIDKGNVQEVMNVGANPCVRPDLENVGADPCVSPDWEEEDSCFDSRNPKKEYVPSRKKGVGKKGWEGPKPAFHAKNKIPLNLPLRKGDSANVQERLSSPCGNAVPLFVKEGAGEIMNTPGVAKGLTGCGAAGGSADGMTVVTENGRTLYYDASKRLTRLEDAKSTYNYQYPDNLATATENVSVILEKKQLKDGRWAVFDQDGGITKLIIPGQTQGSAPTEILAKDLAADVLKAIQTELKDEVFTTAYDAKGQLLYTVCVSGAASYYRDGVLEATYDENGVVTEYDYVIDEKTGQIIGTEVIREGSSRIYDKDGKLITIDMNVQGADIYTKGTNQYIFKDGQISEVKTFEGITYQYESLADGRSCARVSASDVDAKDTQIKEIIYRKNSSLEKVIYKTKAEEYYDENGRLIAMVSPQGMRTDYTYTLDTQGKVVSLKGICQNEELLYTEKGELSSVLIKESTRQIRITYQAGMSVKTEEILSNNATNTNTRIAFFDPYTNTNAVYEGGRLIQETTSSNVTKTYTYEPIPNAPADSCGYRLLRVRIAQSGVVCKEFAYSYATDGTNTIQDQDNIRRVYDKDGNLTKIYFKNGDAFNVAQTTDGVTLKREGTLPSGITAIASYFLDKDWKLVKTELSNGTFLEYTAMGKLSKHLDQYGAVIQHYEYDTQGNLIASHLEKARELLIRDVKISVRKFVEYAKAYEDNAVRARQNIALQMQKSYDDLAKSIAEARAVWQKAWEEVTKPGNHATDEDRARVQAQGEEINSAERNGQIQIAQNYAKIFSSLETEIAQGRTDLVKEATRFSDTVTKYITDISYAEVLSLAMESCRSTLGRDMTDDEQNALKKQIEESIRKEIADRYLVLIQKVTDFAKILSSAEQSYYADKVSQYKHQAVLLLPLIAAGVDLEQLTGAFVRSIDPYAILFESTGDQGAIILKDCCLCAVNCTKTISSLLTKTSEYMALSSFDLTKRAALLSSAQEALSLITQYKALLADKSPISGQYGISLSQAQLLVAQLEDLLVHYTEGLCAAPGQYDTWFHGYYAGRIQMSTANLMVETQTHFRQKDILRNYQLFEDGVRGFYSAAAFCEMTGYSKLPKSDGTGGYWLIPVYQQKPPQTFEVGDKLRIWCAPSKSEVKALIRLLPSGVDPNNPVGILPDTYTLTAGGYVDITVTSANAQFFKDIVQISVHTGEKPWNSFSLGLGNGYAQISQVQVIRKSGALEVVLNSPEITTLTALLDQAGGQAQAFSLADYHQRETLTAKNIFSEASPGYYSGFVLTTPVTFVAGELVRIKCSNPGTKVKIRFLAKDTPPDSNMGILPGIYEVDKDGYITICVPSGGLSNIIQISVHGGPNPWGCYPLGQSNGGTVINSIAVWEENIKPSGTMSSLISHDYQVKIKKDCITSYSDTMTKSTEYTQTNEERAAILTSLTEKLNQVQRGPPEARAAVFAWLGLTEEEVALRLSQDTGACHPDQREGSIFLDADYIQKTVVYLTNSPKAFGRCAYKALEVLLAQNNRHLQGHPEAKAEGSLLTDSSLAFGEIQNDATIDATELAAKVFLIEILTHNLDIENSSITLSMYSIQKTALTYGIVLNGYQINPAQFFVDQQLTTNNQQPFIAMVDDSHYVVITGIDSTAKTITYYDPSVGKDGSSKTMNLDEFVSQAKPYILTSQTITPNAEIQVLDVNQTKMIRGGFFFIFAAIGALIGAITAAVTAVAGAIGALVAGIGTALAGIGTMVANMTGLSALGSMLGIGAGAGTVTGLAGVLGLSPGIGAVMVNTISAIALNFGVTKGLQALGVSSTISNLAGAWIGGAITAGLPGALTSLASCGVSELGNHFKWNPILTSIASIGVGALVGGAFKADAYIKECAEKGITIAFGNAMQTVFKSQILPNIVGELAFGGITLLGEKLGIDPRVNYLMGTVGRCFGASVSQIPLGAMSATDIFKNVISGAAQGVIQLGIEAAGQSLLGLSPLVTGLVAAGLGTLTQGIVNGSVVGAMKDGVKKLAWEYFTLGNPYYAADGTKLDPDVWAIASYHARLNGFVYQIAEVGLLDTLEQYAAAVLTSHGTSAIYAAGVTAMQRAIADLKNTGKAKIEVVKETEKEKIILKDDGTAQTAEIKETDAQGNTEIEIVQYGKGKLTEEQKQKLTTHYGKETADKIEAHVAKEGQTTPCETKEVGLKKSQDGTATQVKTKEGNYELLTPANAKKVCDVVSWLPVPILGDLGTIGSIGLDPSMGMLEKAISISIALALPCAIEKTPWGKTVTNCAAKAVSKALTPLAERFGKSMVGKWFGEVGEKAASLWGKAFPRLSPLKYSQTTASFRFSEGGKFAGQTIGQVAIKLRSGALKPSDVPIDYIVREGNTLIMNTRSSLALKWAGIPESKWVLINKTGVADMEKEITRRLAHNNLSSSGTDVIRISGKGESVGSIFD